jgi:Na+/melibiose symporter-like transporter
MLQQRHAALVFGGYEREENHMQQTMPRSRWQRWRPVLLYGIPLGVLVAVVFLITLTRNYWLSTQNALLIGWLLYLLIPCIAEYRYRSQNRQGGEENSLIGVRMGLTGWTISASVATVTLIVSLIIYDVTLPPPGQSVAHVFYAPPDLALIFTIAFLLFIYVLNTIGVVLSLIGASIGGALGSRRAKRLERRVQRTT